MIKLSFKKFKNYIRGKILYWLIGEPSDPCYKLYDITDILELLENKGY